MPSLVALPGRRALLLVPFGLLVAPAGPRAVPGRIHAPDGVALDGHDPVAFVTRGQPVPGDPRIAAEWGGALWRFGSAAHRDRFLAAPEPYAPAYGGFCAWAMARGYLAPGDPRHWRIVAGRLYVNYDAGVHRRWLRDIPGFIAAADRNWPNLRLG